MNIDKLKLELFEASSNYIDTERKELIDKAINILLEKSDNQQNKFNKPFFQESIEVAIITTSVIGLGISAILSVLLFRAYETKEIDNKYIKLNFPENYSRQIIAILEGLLEANKLDSERVFGLKERKINENISKRSKKFAVNTDTYLTEQGEYFKHFYIAIGEDIRVVLLKLAYHYYKIKNIKEFNDEKRLITCREAKFLYAPMAHQLGLYNIKTLLEETAMKYLNSDIYLNIAKKLAETKNERETYISNFIKPLKKSINELGYKTSVKGRPKSIHSIWKKIQNQGVGLDKIYDLFAIRIILTGEFLNNQEEKSACWNIYSKITDTWTPNPNRLKDWVSAPKASGYESLHTTVIGPEGKWVEVQIRTSRMDEVAEKGSAAHWRYKEIKGQQGHSLWLEKLQNILENPEKENDQNLTAKAELYSDTIFVFTPTGEVRKFKAGATVLDFAYKVHSNLGNHCAGAIIKDKLVGIRHKLTNGDIVDIQTSNSQSPKKEWLEFVVSTHAKSRIKRTLKESEKEKIEEGKRILADIVSKFKSKFNKSDFEMGENKQNLLRKRFGLFKISDLFLQIQSQKISINPQFLYDIFIAPEELSYQNAIDKLVAKVEKSEENESDTKDFLLIDKNMSRIKYEFSKCCNPIPGDNIFAFVTATNGTKIHKTNCPNARELFKRFPYRIMKAAWKSDKSSTKFKAKLKIISEPKPGIVSQISETISKQYYTDLYAINIEESQKETFEGTIGVLINGTKHLDELIKNLRSIPGIMNVERVDKIY